MTREKKLDPVTVEVVGHHLTAIAEQMKRAIIRTARSPIIHEVLALLSGPISCAAPMSW